MQKRLNHLTSLLDYPAVTSLILRAREEMLAWRDIEILINEEARHARNVIICNIDSPADLTIYIDSLVKLVNDDMDSFSPESMILNYYYIQILLELEILIPFWKEKKAS